VMRDEKKWILAKSEFQALRKNIPNLIDTGLVAEYHAILQLFIDSSGEDFSSFRIPNSQLAPMITGFRVATPRYPGTKFYSDEKYCERDFFQRKIDALFHYLQTVESAPQSASQADSPIDYWSLGPAQLEVLALQYNIGGYGDQRGGINRDIIIEQLLKRDRALRPGRPPAHSIHVGTMTGSVIQQGSSQSLATITFQTSDIKNVVEQVKAAMATLPLTEDQCHDLALDIQTIEPQLASPRPKTAIVAECLRSMRTILEGIVSSAVATGLVNELAKYLPS
jgi:hypothetical protein